MCGILGVTCGNCQKRQVFSRLMTCGNDIAHRGEQAWGLLTSNGNEMNLYRTEGRFGEGVTDKLSRSISRKLKGSLGLAHALYSTVGHGGQKWQPKNVQPLDASFHGLPFGLSYNGNIYDFSELKAKARRAGWKFKSDSSDTEVILSSIATSSKTDFIEALREVLPQLKGAFSLIFVYDGKLIGARDKNAIRPLCIGRNEEGFILSSESCAFYSVGAKFVRHVRPGEIVVIGNEGIERCIQWIHNTNCRFCTFEFVYFARPDSIICENKSAYYYRNKAGILLAKEMPVSADLIISAPSGGDIFAEAYASELGIPFRQALFKNRWGMRTFMLPRGANRRMAQRIKLHPLSEVISGKRVCIIEDSIVRGNVCVETVQMCFEAGATEVHVRVGSAPVKKPCYYAVDMATEAELVGARFDVEQIRELLGANSLGYLSLSGMVEATGLPKESLCMACWDNNYPVPPPTE